MTYFSSDRKTPEQAVAGKKALAKARERSLLRGSSCTDLPGASQPCNTSKGQGRVPSAPELVQVSRF